MSSENSGDLVETLLEKLNQTMDFVDSTISLEYTYQHLEKFTFFDGIRFNQQFHHNGYHD